MALRPPRPQRELHAPTTRPRARAAFSVEHHTRLARRLTPRDRWLIRMLHEHRVLTTDQITTMAFPSPRAARHRLLELHQWNVLDRFQPLIGVGSAPMHYVLGPAGAAVLAAEEGLTTTTLGYRRDDILALAHRRTLAHTIAVNDLFAHLVHHSLTQHNLVRHSLTQHSPDQGSGGRRGWGGGEGFRLVAWWSETRCLRVVGDLVRPDAYGRITLPSPPRPRHHPGNPDGRGPGTPGGGVPGGVRSFEWFFELDFGTEPLARLAAKLDGYAQLAAATHATPVLVWLPSPHREAHAREHLTHALHRLNHPDLVPLATTTSAALLPPQPHPDPPHRPGRPEHADRGMLGWLPIARDRHPTGNSHPHPGFHGTRGSGGAAGSGAGARCGLAGLATWWPTASNEMHSGVVAPDRARTRVVELPAPHPLPPHPATSSTAIAAASNPAASNPAEDPAAGWAGRSTTTQPGMAAGGHDGGWSW